MLKLPQGIISYDELTETEIDGEKQSRQRPAGTGTGRISVVLINHHMEFVMNKFTAAVKAFIADEEGVTAIEYALIAALIGVAAVTGATTLGGKLNTLFNAVAAKLPATF